MINPKVGFGEMVDQADQAVTTLSVEQVAERMDQPGVILVDIRDIRELQREGKIPGSRHIPRGMLEFWIHPESPYYRNYFDQCEELILHCNKGWRSALAAFALENLGIPTAHMKGGYAEWQSQGYPTEDHDQ